MPNYNEATDETRAREAGRRLEAGAWMTPTDDERANQRTATTMPLPLTLPTETLTDTMISGLRYEAGCAGDTALVAYCQETRSEEIEVRDQARRVCAEAITDARAMDDATPFVRVTG